MSRGRPSGGLDEGKVVGGRWSVEREGGAATVLVAIWVAALSLLAGSGQESSLRR